ncbi:MAG: ParB N-terminal domain-containing protein [Acidimicrobiales bacterium]
MTSTRTTARIDEITVGDRIRNDLGDLDELMTSIQTVGLLHPIVVDPNLNLIAGARRLAACTELGLETVPIHIAASTADAVTRLRAERDENTARRDFTVSEALALQAKLARIERDDARRRQGARTDLEPSGKFPGSSTGKVSDITAAATGFSGRTLDKARKIHDLANDPNTPAPVREAAQRETARMDTEGKVDRSYRTVTRLEAAYAAGASPEAAEIRERFEAAEADARKLLDLDPVDIINATIEFCSLTTLDDAPALPRPDRHRPRRMAPPTRPMPCRNRPRRRHRLRAVEPLDRPDMTRVVWRCNYPGCGRVFHSRPAYSVHHATAHGKYTTEPRAARKRRQHALEKGLASATEPFVCICGLGFATRPEFATHRMRENHYRPGEDT